MDRKIIYSIIAAALLGFVALVLLIPPSANDDRITRIADAIRSGLSRLMPPSTTKDDIVRLPWRVTADQAGYTTVFGFTLSQTTLAEVREQFGEDGTINLFQTPDQPQPLGVEAFFEQVYLQSLRADFVITLDVDQATLAPMYERGLRISQLESGSKKIKLDPTDVDILLQRPIRAITYLPQARLSTEVIEKRFGTPAERRVEPGTATVHWLYPNRGFDIARSPGGKVVIQYVNRGDFQRLARPLSGPAPTDRN